MSLSRPPARALPPQPPRPPRLPRPPLGDATTRINNQQSVIDSAQALADVSSNPLPHHESHKTGNNLQIPNKPRTLLAIAANKHLTTIVDQEQKDLNRLSQISTSSTNSLGTRKRKTHVGPWHLGKTLGKGATGRVRYARHKLTGQSAAIKIVSKDQAMKMQSKSIAAMDEILATAPVSMTGPKTMPSSIEREVIIMKLIEHPNIISLYDVWENRGEIYLIMEFVEGGELYGHIDKHRRLTEYESVRIFRQMLSGLAYCHGLNIYHRDLKPENILLDKDENVKLVDFGMAALQPQGKWLKTSCGSPHYASPEIAWGHKYRGAPADVWSSGVVLYAMLCGQLPFGTGQEGEDPRDVLKEVVKGQVHVPEDLSEEAEDLILRMLQLNPSDRITIEEIWQHPLMRKYEPFTRHQTHALKWIGGPPAKITEEDCGKQVKSRSQIDRELLRSLCTLWQYTDEEILIAILLSNEPCYEKVFYNKLVKYRDEQLENYQGSMIEFSTSDYHHISKPSIRRSSTQFSLQKYGHNRRISKYSISTDNVRRPSQASGRQSSEVGTEQSYDPYRSSRQQISHTQADHAMITVLRGQSDSSRSRRTPSGAQSLRVPTLGRVESGTVYSIPSSPPPLPMDGNGRPLNLHRDNLARNYSKSSLASSHRSYRQGASTAVRASLSYRRGVSFNHAGKRSSSIMSSSPQIPQVKATLTLQEKYFKDELSHSIPDPPLYTNDNSSQPSQSCEVRSRKEKSAKSYAEEITARKSKRSSQYWKEEARKVSSELENLCDEAFNPPYAPVQPPSVSNIKDERHGNYEEIRAIPVANEARFASSSIVSPQYVAPNETEKNKYRGRPLPRPPLGNQIESKAKNELAKARDLLKRRAEDLSPGALDEVIAQIDRLMQQSNLGLSDQEYQKRVASAPARSIDLIPLSPVKEIDESNRRQAAEVSADQSQQGPRVASEPVPAKYIKLTSRKQHAGDRPTIRLVDFDSVARPEPLVIRKRSTDSVNPEKVIKKKSSLEQLFKSVTNSGKAQYTFNDAVRRPNSRLGCNSDRESGSQGLLDPIIEDENKENEDPTLVKRHSAGSDTKKTPWFRRNRTDLGGVASDPPPTPPLKNDWVFQEKPKKRTTQGRCTSDVPREDPNQSEHKQAAFGRSKIFKIFSKRDTKELHDASELALTGRDLDDTECIDHFSTASVTWTSSHLESNSTTSVNLHQNQNRIRSNDIPIARLIQPQPQNWLARFLHIKPASKVFTFQVSSIKARKDIAGILRDWKRYGIRDLVVDKVAGRLWARVAEENLLNMKSVSLALELFPIFVRGRRANLSVGRFTQEKGAKSSFERVVAALEEVLERRGCLIKEKKRAREMARCLQGM
ncbi:hypothetical protein MMC11_007005 [Xylographa trunciseda]|nr:hypothetical protein [Xylographa trunciseda]